VSEIAGKSVTTIEGLSPTSSHPLQKAWLAEQVPQCGYCQSGQIMRAADLLKQNPKPTREQIVEHMSTNICRCGTYQRIVRAIERAAKEACHEQAPSRASNLRCPPSGDDRRRRTDVRVALGGRADAAVLAAERAGKALNPWVSIATDGTITIMSAATEMGQGSMTSLPLIIAEELDADWSRVRIVPAPPNDKIYGNPGFGGMMYTAGSRGDELLHAAAQFGAQVRRVLLDNAARKLERAGRGADHRAERGGARQIRPQAELRRDRGVRRGAGQGARDQAGAAQEAERLPPDRQGRDAGRAAEQGQRHRAIRIDVQVPGMLYGAVLRAPVEGAAPDKIDDAKAKAIAGVIASCRLPYGVGVLAETPWAAFKARQALGAVTWTATGTAWGFDSDKGIDAFAAARKI
jgi:isoquinoline 1-oxidoreductase beta subunit